MTSITMNNAMYASGNGAPLDPRSKALLTPKYIIAAATIVMIATWTLILRQNRWQQFRSARFSAFSSSRVFSPRSNLAKFSLVLWRLNGSNE